MTATAAALFNLIKWFFLLGVVIGLLNSPVGAQTPTKKTDETGATLGIGRIIETKEKDVKDGTILSTSDHGPAPTTLAYDPQVLGVVSRDAAVVLSPNNATAGGVPVISVGSVYVLVSSKGGEIKAGDLITSSSIPGVGIKAINAGYVLGTALENYTNSDPTAVGKIAVDLDLHYFNSKPIFPGSLSDILKIALFPTKEAPTPFIKYMVAAIVVIASFVLGFMSFGRTAAKGVEALGRNPAASRIIQLGIIFNIIIVLAIILAGLIVAFLILRL